MKRILALVALACTVAGAQAQAPQQGPQPPEIAAKSYILVDVTSHQVLAERNADQPNDPASLTKLMTAYVAFDALKQKKLTMDQKVTVSKRAWDERKGEPSLMFIDTTMTPTVDELLHGVIIQSGNDASVAIAEAVGGSVETFVDMMNRQAAAWGLKNTHFTNVTGITAPGHHSSARDIAVIAEHIITDHPEYYPLYSQKDYTYNHIHQDNRNMLLRRDPTVDGMKTGYTDAAGYCLVASAIRDFPNGKRRLISVVMGTASKEARATESQKLLNWGFSAWDDVKLFDAGKPVATVPIWKGTAKEAKLGAPGPLFVSVPRGEGDKLKTQIERKDPLVAPLPKGERVGTIKVSTTGGATVAQVPLVALEAVPQAGLFGRMWDALRLWIK
jgi:D-alanyl-D-alanine carboxypeptidase (penicillin-binding protein 5/6)